MRIRVPGDKSITQRALLLGGLADGRSRIRRPLTGADPRSTAGAVAGLGVEISDFGPDTSELIIAGRGQDGLRAPTGVLDLGNSGTGSRLLLGVLAGQRFDATLTGDASLRSRPMRRVTDPLGAMGARFRWEGEEGRLPLTVLGGALKSVDLDLAVASAQVKSALLLAGVASRVPVLLTEPGPSRDHTERMLESVGARVITHVRGPGRRVEFRDPPERLSPLDLTVPGDPSSAAFFLLAALLGVCPEIEVEGVGLNPTRTGVVDLFRRMGGRIEAEVTSEEGGEVTGTLGATRSTLRGIDVVHDDVVRAIDELPAVAVAAARAQGVTRITGAGELRVKETDRIRAMVVNLRAVGVSVEELDDGMEIEGTDRPLRGRVDAFHDHRIAMVFGVLGAQPGNEIEVVGRDAVDVSFPTFWGQLEEVRTG